MNAEKTTDNKHLRPAEMAQYIDHTILKPDAVREDIRRLCAEAAQYGFASVCVNPCHVKLASGLLAGTGVLACTVVGFPLGACTPESKAAEAKDAVLNGAQEVDMVLPIGAAKSGDWDLVIADIRGVAQAVRGRAIVKVILETCLLTDDEIARACNAAEQAGAHFVKTSTGFSTGGATEEHVRLMRKTVGERLGVKASGGIRDYKTALAMVRAGANRLGTSAGIKIVAEDPF